MIDGKARGCGASRRIDPPRARFSAPQPHFFPYAHEELEKPFAEKKTLGEIVAWLENIQPDIVVAQWPLDTHPNHQVVGMSTWMAYDHAGRVWGVEGPNAVKAKKGWNLYYYEVCTFTKPEDVETVAFHPNAYVDIGKVRDVKRKAVDCLKSQGPEAGWVDQERIHARRGKECGVPYAEAFFLVEAKPGCPLLPVPVRARQTVTLRSPATFPSPFPLKHVPGHRPMRAILACRVASIVPTAFFMVLAGSALAAKVEIDAPIVPKPGDSIVVRIQFEKPLDTATKPSADLILPAGEPQGTPRGAMEQGWNALDLRSSQARFEQGGLRGWLVRAAAATDGTDMVVHEEPFLVGSEPLLTQLRKMADWMGRPSP